MAEQLGHLKTNHPLVAAKKQHLQVLRRRFKIARELKNDSIKENHLREILATLGVAKEPKDLLLSDLLNCDLLA